MATIDVQSETETDRGWRYAVEVQQDDQSYQYDVTLSWSDYDHWSHGRSRPERVVKAAFEFLLERESASMILSRFDCAVIRRYFPDVDQRLPQLI